KPRCGNGIIDSGEQCDDGNTTNGDGCENNCTRPSCGNGIVDQGEECDDHNNVNGDGCEANCRLPYCGNSIFDTGEQCDDGNLTNGDGCSSTCTVEKPPVQSGCTYTQGYWKNHNAYQNNRSQRLPWPISENTMLCGKTWLAILGMTPRGDAWYILAH